MWALVWTVEVRLLDWLGSDRRNEFLWFAVSIVACQGPHRKLSSGDLQAQHSSPFCIAGTPVLRRPKKEEQRSLRSLCTQTDAEESEVELGGFYLRNSTRLFFFLINSSG